VNILQHIPKGRQNAITRAELEKATKTSDRINRDNIKTMRDLGIPIVNLKDGTGYYIAETEEEKAVEYALLMSYACSILKTAKTFLPSGVDGNQITIGELLGKYQNGDVK
jgi:hypothetical protein